MYYYHDGVNEVGPFDKEKMADLAQTQLIGSGTLVRPADGGMWGPLAQVLNMPADPSHPLHAQAEHAALASGAEEFADVPVHINPAGSLALVSQSHPEATIAETSSGWLTHPQTPWRRYAARLLDLVVYGTLAFFLVGFVFYSIAPASADRFFFALEAPGGTIIDVVLTAIFASLLSGCTIGVSGFSLGKLIFGVKVTRMDGSNLGILSGVSRDISVLVRGMGLGIPVIALITMSMSYRRLTTKDATAWDEGKYTVWHRPSGTGQYMLNVVGILLIIFSQWAIRSLGEL